MTMRQLTAITTYLCCSAAIVTGMPASSSQVTQPTIEQMPATLETEFALSALPAGMRGHATVYLLDPRKGVQRSRQGTSGVTSLVERTARERADFRNDIYLPLCYDAAGTQSFLKVIMEAATTAYSRNEPCWFKS